MVKKVNQKYDAIHKIKVLFKIQGECKTEEDIVENIGHDGLRRSRVEIV